MEPMTRIHEATGVTVRSNGEVCIPANYHYPEHWTVGTLDRSTGYRVVMVKHKKLAVHRIIAETFIPNPENLPCVDHINHDRTDNRVENLRWVTYKDNRENSIAVLNRADYGVRFCEDRKTYNHNYHEANKERIHAHQKAYRNARRG